MLNALRKQNHLLPALVLIGGLCFSAGLWSLKPFLGFVAVGGTLFFVYLEVITQWAFRAPIRRKPAVDDQRFEQLMIASNGRQLAHYIAEGKPGAPLVWMCHGWTAGAFRMVSRAEPFLERGWNVVLVDLPGHGVSDGLTKWSAEESTTLLLDAIQQLHAERPSLFAAGVVHYGHSIGAFIGLRISRRRHEINPEIKFRGWVLESPMTGYTEIFDETCKLLRIPSPLRPVVLRKTLRHFNALNEGAKFSRLSDADVPQWGMPLENTLLVQAMPDNRLGSVHHERLIHLMEAGDAPELFSKALLEDLTHSGSHISPSRDAVMRAWIEEHYRAHSSA